MHRSHDKGFEKSAIDMLSAWATANQLVLGQVKVEEKSNEITSSTKIAKKVINREGEYTLAWKENQGNLYEYVEFLLNDLEASQYKNFADDYEKMVNKDHGRIEIRECWAVSDPDVLCHLYGYLNWEKLSTAIRIRSEHRVGEKRSFKDRNYIAGITGVSKILDVVRSHWGKCKNKCIRF